MLLRTKLTAGTLICGGVYYWDSFLWFQCAVSCNPHWIFLFLWAKFIVAFDVREKSLTGHVSVVMHKHERIFNSIT